MTLVKPSFCHELAEPDREGAGYKNFTQKPIYSRQNNKSIIIILYVFKNHDARRYANANRNRFSAAGNHNPITA